MYLCIYVFMYLCIYVFMYLCIASSFIMAMSPLSVENTLVLKALPCWGGLGGERLK